MDVNNEDNLKNLKESLDISALNDMKFRIPTMLLFPFLIGSEKSKNIKVSPSCFINEMQMTTEQRLEKVIKFMNKKTFSRSCELPTTFRATPHIVLFQSCEPGRTYSLLLNIQNTLQVLRSLRMHCKHSPYFQVTYFSKASTKVAAGMSVNFNVKFTPMKWTDYYHKITFETEDESFSIPIMALSPRPLLDFPDSVQMDDVIVKVSCHKVLFVRNIGQVPATFSLIVESPFSVSPRKAVLNINETIHIQLSFESDIVGDFSRSMVIRYETGEELVTDIQCTARNGNTGIDNDTVYFVDTYMSLKRQMSFSVYNRTDHKVHFYWLKYPTAVHDKIEIDRMKTGMDAVRETETLRCNKIEYKEIVSEELISAVYKRVYDHESASISYKDFEYIHPNFTIIPTSGELWPNSSSTVNIIFSPETASVYESIAYCDIGGRDSRIPLHIKGSGIGPVMKLNLDVLDVENIFLCSVNKYEVVVNNCGVIPGHIEYVPQKCVFGGQLTCTPDKHCIAPMECKAFCVSYSSNRHGRFTEDVCFRIVESRKIIKLLLNGFVVNPTLSFEELSLDFGEIAVGFPSHRSVTLNNKSLVEVLFVLYVQNDGTEEPVSYEYFAESRNKPMLTYNAKEFCVNPETGVLKANSSINVQITLLTNITRRHSTILVAENRDTEAEPVKLSMTYLSSVTEVICEPETMLMSFSFIDYPYIREFCLKNIGGLPGYFYLKQETALNEVSYTTDRIEGLLKPHESVTITITVKVLKKGSFQKAVQMLLFGARLACIICTISCIGQGPVVTPNETVLNYGRVAIRKPTSLGFEISNASPIPAYFTAKIDSKRQAKWSVEPSTGVIEREESLNFNITLTVMDSGNISAILIILIENSRVITIDLRAFGYGSSIFIEPNIFPDYDFGYVFSHHHCKVHLKIENDGSRHHLLQFLSKKISIGATKTSDPEKWTYFQFVPSKLELAGGEKKEILLEGRCNSVREVCEEFSCWALINKQGLRQCLGTCIIKANFIAPVVELSETTIEFDINIGPNEIHNFMLIKELHIKNKTALPITLELQTNKPFSVTDGEEMESEKEIHIQSNANFIICLAFKPRPQPLLDSTVSQGILKIAYREHPNQDKVYLIGRLNFPNVKLSHSAVNFGCIPLCTTDHRIITLTNISPLEVKYKWKWNEEAVNIAYFSSKCKDFTNAHEADVQTLYFISEQSAANAGDKDSNFLAWPMDFKEVHPLPEKVVTREDSNNDVLIQDLLHKKLSPLSAVYFSADSLLPIFDALPIQNPQTNLINTVLDISPWRGCLKPFESQAVSIGFRPDMKMSVKATAVCHVKGGPADVITFTGLSDDHHFGISSTKLDFGFKLFSDICTEVITLTNRGELDFVYKTSAVKLVASSPTLEHVMEAGMLTVEPSGNTLPAHTTAELVVRYYPGIAGEFNETFMIEIDYLPPISVSVMGCGLFPQVSLNLPHMPQFKIPINWMYCAIASLSSPRFEFLSVYEHYRWRKSKISSCFIEDPELSDWCIISYDDDFPEAVDIDMALERTIVHNLIKSNPSLLPQMFQSRNKSIPSLQIPGYVLDFGCVIIGTSVENTIIVENRGFVKVDFSLVFNIPEKKLKQDGVWIDNHTYVGLPVRRSVPIYITLRPLPERYTATQEELNVYFYIKVTHGAMIPVLVKAVFTVPYIVTDTNIINFGNVQCGHCKIVSIAIKNVGHVSCDWSASLRVGKKRRKESIICDIPFFVRNPTGMYLPKTAGLLEVAFQPKEEEIYEAHLQLKMMHNPEILILRLQGCGVEPKLSISEEFINFGALLPYAEPVFKQFTISNPCQFPVEFYFTQYDNFIYDEDRVLRILTLYYDEDKLILPQHLYTTRMMPELVQFYEKLCNELNLKLKASTESIDLAGEVASSGNEEYVLRTSEDYARSRNSADLILRSLTKGSSDKKDLAEMDTYMTEDLLNAYINEKHEQNTIPEDPLLLKVHTTPIVPDKSSSDRLESEHGILIMFHGAPHSDYVYWANRAARKLSLKVINLDQMILEEASSSVKICALKVCEAISNKYEEMFQGMGVLESTEARNETPVIALDDLTKKVEMILTRLDQTTENVHQMKSDVSRKQNRPTASKASRHGVAANQPDIDVFCNISIETITELIGMRLKEEVRAPGVIIESLTGKFLKNAHMVAHMLLSIVGNIHYIHFITLFINSETYSQWLELEEKKKEVLKLQEQKRKIANFSRMTSQYIEKLSAEDRHLINSTLNARRERYKEKLDIVKAKNKGKLFSMLKGEDLKKNKLQKNDGKRKDVTMKTQKTQRVGTSNRTRSTKNKEATHIQIRSMDKSRSRSISRETKRSKSSDSKSKDSSKRKKGRIMTAKKLIAHETEIKFEQYEVELASLSSLLESWNRLLGHTVGHATDNLFHQTYSPTRKSRPKRTIGAFSHQESTIKTVDSKFVGIPVTLIKLNEYKNLTSLHTSIIKLVAASPDLNEARVKSVEWDEIGIPEPLSLVCVVKPAARIKPNILHAFEISDTVEERSGGDRIDKTSDLKDQEENGKSIKSRPSNTMKKKTKRGSKRSLRPSISSDFNKEDVTAKPQFTTRKILNPGEEMSWHIQFSPHHQSVFYEEIPLEISCWRKMYNLKCKAVCDIPRIDTNPKIMFQKVLESLNPGTISHCVYLLDTEIFYFGPVLCSPQKSKDRTYELVTSLQFLNLSEITASITFGFRNYENDESEECFGFSHKMLIIQPGESKQLEVYACPNTCGKLHETLVYSVGNNPQIGQIKLSCIGIIPSFDYNPKIINFERVLLYRKEAHTLHLCNNCYEPLGWKLTGYEELGEQVTISKVSGIIDPMTTNDVFFHFKAETVEVNNKMLNIEVYDSQFRGHPFFTEQLAVNVESVDVLVDIIFPKQKFSFLYYKNIKVGKKEVLSFIMKNKGKYDIAFQIKFAEHHSEQFMQLQFEPQSILTFSPKSGVLQKTGKPVTVQVSCLCSKALNITEIPLLKVWLIDTGPKASPVAAIPIGITITSFTAKFRVTPTQDINFGPMVIGSKLTRSIMIENLGKFDLQYRILSREQANMEDDTTSRVKPLVSTPKLKSKNEERKNTAALRMKLDKLQMGSELQIGAFIVRESRGKLEIGQSVNIDVDCYVPEVGTCEEEVVIRFNNCAPADRKGVTLKLMADAHCQKLNFDNKDFIFQEAQQVNSINSIHSPNDHGNPCVIYSAEDNTLRFLNVCVGFQKELALHLHLQNSELVPCEVTATTLKSNKQNDDQVFSVSPTKMTVPSHCARPVLVGFSPRQIGVFHDVLQLEVESPNPLISQKFLCTLIGEGYLPQVSITCPLPVLSCKSSNYVLHFPPTETGCYQEKLFTFQNTGSISCKVILEICENEKNVFSLAPDSNTVAAVHMRNQEVGFDNSTILLMKPKQVCTFIVRFTPCEKKEEFCKINLFTMNNPYEDQFVKVRGLGYSDDVFLKGLFTFNNTINEYMLRSESETNGNKQVRKNDLLSRNGSQDIAESFDSKKTLKHKFQNRVDNAVVSRLGKKKLQHDGVDTGSISVTNKSEDSGEQSLFSSRSEVQGNVKYILDFGSSLISEVKRVMFKICNQNTANLYRFEWTAVENITLSPSAGHLSPGSDKEIVATFCSNQHHPIKQNLISCKIYQIEYTRNMSADLVLPVNKDWDTERKIVEWIYTSNDDPVSMQRVLNQEEEPPYEIIEGTTTHIHVITSVISDYANVICSTNNIVFPQTLAYEYEEIVVTLTNKSSIEAEYTWNILDMKRNVVDESATAECGFVSVSSVRPKLQPLPYKHRRPVTASSSACKRPRPLTSSLSLFNERVDKTTSTTGLLYSTSLQFAPISVEPEYGKIPQNSAITSKIIFSPADLYSYTCKLLLEVKGSDPKNEPVMVSVAGSSMMPCCHLYIHDYKPTTTRIVDLHTHVLEFTVLGVDKVITKFVNMINPTDENYSFHWYEVKKHPVITVSPFSCSKHSGHLQSRKEMEVKFNFTPPNTGVFESHWILSIPTREIKKLIILIGTASEPNVTFVPSYLKLKPTLKGVTAIGSVALVNNEDTDLNFFIEKSSLLSEGSAFLEVDPMQGILEAHNQKLLSINMIPTSGGIASFKLRVRVQKLKQPLVLTVDGECFIIEPVLTYECSSKERVDMSTEEDNFINLGTLTSRIPENLIFTLTNVGKPTIYYCWSWDSEAFEKACVSLNCLCLRGTVTSCSKATLRVQLTPLRKVAFKNIRLTLESTKGPHYNILLSGTAAAPLYKFSFHNYNFGLCFVQTSKSKYYRTGLVFHNKDEVPLILENKSEDSDAFTVEMTQSKVPARGELVIPIYFHPMMCQPYEEVITFSVNNFFTFNLVLSGEVAELNVELVKKSDGLINFGAVVRGHTASRTVEVINKSRVSLSGHFTIVSNNKENSDKPDTVVEPSSPITMIPNKIVKLLILYAPHITTKSFIKHVIMTFQDIKQSICTIKGSCIGAELNLDRYYIPFGSVVLGNHSAARIMLINTGDLTVKFIWRVKNTREFTISPQEGYSTSGSETLLTVTFCPERLQAEIRTEAICEIDKFDDLKLTLTGSCVDLPPPIDTILFSCPVRKYEEKQVTLNNNLGLAVWFSPVISGEYFSTDRIIEIKPYSSANLSVVYSPLQMTEPEKVHEGTLTIPLEGGSCLLYVLQGSAEEPEAEASVLVKTTTHKNTTKLLSVSNWLLTSQRFLATIKPLEGNSQIIYLISGNDYIDVPSKQCCDYTVNFMCFQPCIITFQVKFKSESSAEYQWYDLCFEVSQCNPIDELKMTTNIRKPVTQSVHIENPLAVSALLEKFSSTSKNITCPNLPSSIEPMGKEEIVFKYLPFHLTEETAELKIASPQLGLMLYIVQLTALPPKMEPSVYISCELGLQASVTVFIHNSSAQEAKFTSSVSHSDIKVDKVAKALPDETVNVTIVYEPSSLDNETIYVKLLSDETGEFTFPVITTCLLPKPSGPFIVHEGSQLIIHFKNIFSKTKTFCWYVESPEFSIDSSTATLESKQEIDILVEMSENISHELRNSLPATSKLIVTISDLSLQHIKWTYYLRGIYKT